MLHTEDLEDLGTTVAPVDRTGRCDGASGRAADVFTSVHPQDLPVITNLRE